MTDLELAAACLAGDSSAIAAFEEGAMQAAREHLSRLGFTTSDIDEALQRTRTKLLVDRGLELFRGRGPVTAFVRTVAVRSALDTHRKASREVELGELVMAPCADPELEYMRTLYADHLVGAVRSAWTRLPAHERFILSLRIYENMSIDDIARVYQLHRASAARRAASARSSLIAQTRACLRERLDVGDETLDSILRVVTTSVQLPLGEPLAT